VDVCNYLADDDDFLFIFCSHFEVECFGFCLKVKCFRY